MKILRLKCSSCGMTHALLTMDIIPFSAYSIQAFLALIAMCMEPQGSVLRTGEKTGVSYQLLYRFLLIFHEFRQQLSLFLRLETLWESPAQPQESQLLALLKAQPPPWPGSRFFARFHTPLFVHRQSSDSYPLVYAASFS